MGLLGQLDGMQGGGKIVLLAHCSREWGRRNLLINFHTPPTLPPSISILHQLKPCIL